MRVRYLLGVALFLALGLAACNGSEPEQPVQENWEVVLKDLPGALASVWGTGPDDIWTVGADGGREVGPLVYHYDGIEWQRMDTGQSGDLWWVFGFPGGPVFMGGSGGMILRFHDGEFERMTTPSTATVYGIWGTAQNDLWAVGGHASSGAFAWHFDGGTWSPAEGFPQDVVQYASLFKLTGRSAEDIWMVGTGGVALHYDGQRFERASSGTDRTLFTVHADAERFVAVGGFGSGVLVENIGDGWKDVTPSGALHAIGVYLTGNGEGYAVGVDGSVLRRDGNAWKSVDTGINIVEAFHGVWVDSEGGVWAVGGQVLAPPLVDGIMVYRPPDGGETTP